MVEILIRYHEAFVSGLRITLSICALVWISGCLMGLALATISRLISESFEVATVILFRIIESVPILVLLFWFHYPMQALMGVVIDPFYTTVLILSVLNALSVFSIVTNSAKSIPKEYLDVALASHVSRKIIFFDIELPLALRLAAGSLLSAQVYILHLSIFASLISVEEIFRVAQQVNSVEYKPIPIYSALALFFLLICLPLNLLAVWLSRHYKTSFSF